MFVPRNKEIWLKKIYFIINLDHFQIQVIEYTFSSNDQNCETTSF